MLWNIPEKWKFGALIGVIIGFLASCTTGTSTETSNVPQVNVAASPGDYHVAKTGMDENTCTEATSPSQPKLTINGGIACLAAGDTLIVHAGTYNEKFDDVPSGTSWENATTIRVKSGDTVVINRVSGSFLRCGRFNNKQYVEIDGFICGAAGDDLYEGFKLEGTTHHIRLQNMEIKDTAQNGILDTVGNTFGAGGGNEFLNLDIHGTGFIIGTGHGLYITSSDNKVWNCQIHGNNKYGIHFWNPRSDSDDNDIRYNRSWDNGAAGIQGSGIVVSGNNNLIANNIFWNNLQSGIQIGGNSNLIYNNTSFSNFGIGISVDSGNGTLITNNIIYANGGTIQDLGTGTVQTTNLTTNPLFTNAAADDFTLQSGSDAIDSGTTLAEVQDDFLGISRPQPLGASYDIGAYERIP